MSIPRSKTNQYGDEAELAVLPRAGEPHRCPVRVLETWLSLAGLTDGPVFRRVTNSNRVGTTSPGPWAA